MDGLSVSIVSGATCLSDIKKVSGGKSAVAAAEVAVFYAENSPIKICRECKTAASRCEKFETNNGIPDSFRIPKISSLYDPCHGLVFTT
jgi:hypothetical protein